MSKNPDIEQKLDDLSAHISQFITAYTAKTDARLDALEKQMAKMCESSERHMTLTDEKLRSLEEKLEQLSQKDSNRVWEDGKRVGLRPKPVYDALRGEGVNRAEALRMLRNLGVIQGSGDGKNTRVVRPKPPRDPKPVRAVILILRGEDDG